MAGLDLKHSAPHKGGAVEVIQIVVPLFIVLRCSADISRKRGTKAPRKDRLVKCFE